METKEDIVSFLKSIRTPESLVLIGMGNLDRSDDGLGIDLVSRLKTQHPDRVFSEHERSVEGIVLELFDRAEFETVLFIDAMDFGGKPGDVKIFSVNDIEKFVPAFSTHKIPISFLMKIIHENGRKPFLLGVQPESLELFGEMSLSVKTTLDRLSEKLTQFLI